MPIATIQLVKDWDCLIKYGT